MSPIVRVDRNRWQTSLPLIATSLAGLLCAGQVIKTSFGSADSSDVAASVMQGEHFAPGALEAASRSLSSERRGCSERLLRDTLVIQLRVAESTFDTLDTAAYDITVSAVDQTARQLLGCSPRQGFGWLSLFWVRLQREGPTDKVFELLRRSYVYAPHEGWISLFRNRLVIARMSTMPPDIQISATAEFADIVGSRFSEAAADIFAKAIPHVQAQLLESLIDVPLDMRKAFAYQLRLIGKTLNVPGVPVRPDRPWT